MLKRVHKTPKHPRIASGKAKSRTGKRLTRARRTGLSAAAGLRLAAGSLELDSVLGQENDEVAPFTYHAPQTALDDLKQRLAQTRWPERETTNDWSEGVPLEKTRALIDYWQTDYDWRRCEKELNRFPQFRTQIDGLAIHFIHVRSKNPNPLPIILTHGWPSTILLFRDVIEPLTNPTAHGGKAEDAFDVVIPSLPGFAFSDKATERGWNAKRTAQAWATLMSRLGYKRYVAQGGDWGAFVTTAMAQERAPGLIAIHLNFPQVIPNHLPDKLSPDQQRAMEVLNRFRSEGSGYLTMQATRPQTIGYALMDSPAGQAAWIYDIYNAGTGNLGDPEKAISQDKILDEITLYWLTGTAASSARFYYEQRALLGKSNNPGRVDLPVGVSIFRHDLPAPRSWARDVYPNLFYWHQLDQGGHFASLEKPDLFVEELRTCFRNVRQTDRPKPIQ
jgi:pimeloyl-ACP methyl ester carboxylesterase